MKLRKEQEYALELYTAIAGLLDEENENHRYDIETLDLTKFFTGIVIASNMLFDKLTGDKQDLFEYNALNTKLIHQYLMDKKENE